MSLTRDKIILVSAVMASILMITLGYFLVIGPQRENHATAVTNVESARAKNDTLDRKVQQLKAQYGNLPEKQAELATIQQAFPEQEALPALIRELDAVALRSGVTLMSLAPGTLGPLGATSPVATAAPTASNGAGVDTNPSGTVGGGLNLPGAVPGQGGSLPNGGSILRLPVSFKTIGGFFQTETMLKELQTNTPRAFLVTSLNFEAQKTAAASGGNPATQEGDVSLSVEGAVFVMHLPGTTKNTAGGTAGSQGGTVDGAPGSAPSTARPTGPTPTIPKSTIQPGSGN